MNWICPNCNETHEEQFDSCWKCGTRQDGSKVEPVHESIEFGGTGSAPMLPCSTTPQMPGRVIESAKGIVCGEAIMGANVLRNMVAGFTDFVGGRSGVYESKLREGRGIALRDMVEEATRLGADAVVGVDFDYETVGDTMFMVSASGTAVVLKPLDGGQARARDGAEI